MDPAIVNYIQGILNLVAKSEEKNEIIIVRKIFRKMMTSISTIESFMNIMKIQWL